MSDSVLITLIVVVAIIVILFLFKEKLSQFIFKANKDGVETTLKTHTPPNARAPKPPPAAATTTQPTAGATTKVGNVKNSQLYNSGAGSDAHLEAKDVTDSTVINSRGNIDINKPK